MYEIAYLRPQTLAEALDLLDSYRCKILAGGTDLLVQINRGTEQGICLLDIKGLEETRRLSYIPGQGLFIGSGITVNQLAATPEVGQKYPALRDAANGLASYQLRNRATLVGNICNASPAADLAPPLLVFDAMVHVAGKEGNKTLPIAEFFAGPKQTVLLPGEIVMGVSLPDTPDEDRSVYNKQTRIKGHDLGIVGVAARITAEGKVCLAMSSVAPTPKRLYELEQQIAQKGLTPDIATWAGEQVHRYIRPISDVRSSAEYRSHMAGVLVKRAILQLLAGRGNNV